MKNLLFIVVATLITISCRKKVEIDLNESSPKIVMEANYTANDSTVRVRVTKTKSYFGESATPEINNATITITDQSGNVSSVGLASNGNYVLSGYAPQWNTTYKMNVIVDGVNYESSCYLRDTISLIRPMKTEFIPSFFGSDLGEAPYVEYQDPANTTGDATIAILSINEDRLDRIADVMTSDDELTNGNLFSRPFFSGLGVPGDSLTLELQTVDIRVLRYYDQLKGIGNPNNAAPANPDYMWTNEALGYFSAYGTSVSWKVIP